MTRGTVDEIIELYSPESKTRVGREELNSRDKSLGLARVSCGSG